MGVRRPSITRSTADAIRKSFRSSPSDANSVTPNGAPAEARPAGSATIVDVREASEWEQGHVPGARHVSKSYIEQQIEGAAPDRDAPVILYCAGGVRSLFAAQTLADADPIVASRLGFKYLVFDVPALITKQ